MSISVQCLTQHNTTHLSLYFCVVLIKGIRNTVLSRVEGLFVRDLQDEFWIDTVYTVHGTAGNYSATFDLHTLQFTVTHALGFSVLTSRILATDFTTVSL
jgi:hypothetical protein